jgi:hypothetical protein
LNGGLCVVQHLPTLPVMPDKMEVIKVSLPPSLLVLLLSPSTMTTVILLKIHDDISSPGEIKMRSRDPEKGVRDFDLIPRMDIPVFILLLCSRVVRSNS